MASGGLGFRFTLESSGQLSISTNGRADLLGGYQGFQIDVGQIRQTAVVVYGELLFPMGIYLPSCLAT
jgi:hypothetical protein